MRRLLAFLFLTSALLSLSATVAHAQASGQVLKIGFNNVYRPDCWNPMLVQLTSQTAETRKYQIQVVQEDMDADRVSYASGDVVLEGNHEGQTATVSNYWVYFIPKPTGGGLPDIGNGNLSDLQAQLTVYLCDESGKHLSQLPITTTITNIDPFKDVNDNSRSRKLALLISDGLDMRPHIPSPDDKFLLGMLQNVEAVAVDPRGNDLPSNVIGFEPVDTIIWMDADAAPLTQGTNRALDAIREWVREGGHLIVCQPEQAYKLSALADLLPVKSTKPESFDVKMEQTTDMGVFRRILAVRHRPISGIQHDHPFEQDWPDEAKPFAMARAVPTDDAFVEEWLQWPNADPSLPSRTPFIARKSYGTGSVTWVALDLGNRSIASRRRDGWPLVWDRIFGFDNATEGENVNAKADIEKLDAVFGSGIGSIDLGKSILDLIELNKRTAYLIGLACLFFLMYWLIACPGVLLFLTYRKRPELSWFAYASTAIVAAALTALLVKLVLRGAPEIHHITTVRQSADGSAVALSRFGLYIPRDGVQTISLGGTELRAPFSSYVTPFAINPQFVPNHDEPPLAYDQYNVNVSDGSTTPELAVPYRSTLKKLQAKWIGTVTNGITIAPGWSAPELVDSGNKFIRGGLINHTGVKLNNIYLAFRHPGSALDTSVPTTNDHVYIVSIGAWDKDQILDLSTLMTRDNHLIFEPPDGVPAHLPAAASVAYAPLGADNIPGVWDRFWYRQMHGTSEPSLQFTLPLLSFFDLLSPMSATPNAAAEAAPRFELAHRSARSFNISGPVIAGDMAIVAMSPDNTALPFPLSVDGSNVAGAGCNVYEAVIPINRRAMYPMPASIQPTQPTQPTER